MFVVCIIVILLLFLYFKIFKIPKLSCLNLITGAVKTGKSMLSFHFAKRTYRRVLFSWKLRKFLFGWWYKLRKKQFSEKPLFYSNVPVAGIPYVPFTDDLLLRKKRMAYKSVVWLEEVSLVADSMYFNNADDNERLLLFNKLFGHETYSGYCFYNTQSLKDCHHAIKRCLNSYFFIHSNFKIPFFVVMRVREMIHSEDDSMNVFNQDIEESLKFVVVPKRVWKQYDSHCYSVFTDNLPVVDNEKYIPIPKNPFKRAYLKANHLLTLKKYKTLNVEEFNKNESIKN